MKQRLIDADELKRIAGEAHSMKLAMKNAGIGTIAALTFAVQDAGLSTLVRIADDIPTIDPESLRPRGYWEGFQSDGKDDLFDFMLKAINICNKCKHISMQKSKYCPHCGARMED